MRGTYGGMVNPPGDKKTQLLDNSRGCVESSEESVNSTTKTPGSHQIPLMEVELCETNMTGT